MVSMIGRLRQSTGRMPNTKAKKNSTCSTTTSTVEVVRDTVLRRCSAAPKGLVPGRRNGCVRAISLAKPDIPSQTLPRYPHHIEAHRRTKQGQNLFQWRKSGKNANAPVKVTSCGSI